jgi:uncharacterized RDD family membrane protein YckC
MTQVANSGAGLMAMNPYEIGWYIESADEEIYGPVSRKALCRFLEDQSISPNTLVRPCTQAEAKPAVEQPAIMDQLRVPASGSAVGDRLAEAWPKKSRDRQALAEDALPCAWHKRPAVLVCVRCHAPYCNSCRAKPFRKQFFLCRRCQGGIYNRRIVAYFVDSFVLFAVMMIPAMIAGVILTMMGVSETVLGVVVNLIQLLVVVLFFFRDSAFGGAGPGKRTAGLRVVQTRDGHTPLTHGQAVLRWLSVLIPFFNLVDLSVPYRDPLMRRFGDRWAGTRVIDNDRSLAKARQKIEQRLVRKGVQPAREFGMTMEGLARIV